jgi:ribonuclease Z
MSRELIFFGTGNAAVTRCYNTCFAVRNGEDYLLVDAGGGNQILKLLEDAEISLADIHEMFVTHSHTDHVLGVVWVIRMVATLMRKGKYDGDLRIYCHGELKGILEQLCELTLIKKFTSLIGDRILLIPVSDREVQYAAGMKLTFFDIYSTKTKQYGFRADFEEDGFSLVCPGDEPLNAADEDLAAGCDLLMSEAFCLYEERDIFKPYEKHHSTALDAGELAQRLGVRGLLLYHTEDSGLAARKVRYSMEAGLKFQGSIYVPDDGEKIAF